MTKKPHPLGKPVKAYDQSRLPILALLVVLIMFGTVFGYSFIQSPDRSLTENITLTGLIFMLPALIISGIVWLNIERISPRKVLLLYSGGVQFVSKKGVQAYHWQDTPQVEMVIVKSEGSGEVIQYDYTFKDAAGKQLFKVDSNIYHGIDKKAFTETLKEAHVQGLLNLDTRIERRMKDNNDYD